MFINVTIPVDKLKTIAEVARSALDKYREINETINNLPVVSKELDGQRAIDARQAKLEEYAAQKVELMDTAKAKIEPIISEYQAAIDAQTTPSGEEVESNKDFALFRYGAITSPEQLSRLVKKNPSLVFALNAEKYAKANGWGADFDVMTDEGAVRDFGDEVVNICRRALEFPGGYYDAYVTEDNFLESVAAAYGVLESYQTAAYVGDDEKA